jgi:hypothetical protein
MKLLCPTEEEKAGETLSNFGFGKNVLSITQKRNKNCIWTLLKLKESQSVCKRCC